MACVAMCAPPVRGATMLLMVTLLACGRTPETEHSLFACADDPVGACADLAKQRATLGATYTDELAAKAPNGERLKEIGSCMQAVVVRELDLACRSDACANVCDLHPCAAASGAACTTRCQALVTADTVKASELDSAIVRAAAHPGLCTCQVCDDAEAALCSTLFECTVAP